MGRTSPALDAVSEKYRAMGRWPARTRKLKNHTSHPIENQTDLHDDLGPVEPLREPAIRDEKPATLADQTDFKEKPVQSTHPGDFLKKHPQPEKFGCVECHSRARVSYHLIGAAHTAQERSPRRMSGEEVRLGTAETLETPDAADPFIQASCVKLHGSFETMKGQEVAARGKQCWRNTAGSGLSSWHSEGGPISWTWRKKPPNKPLSRIDFFLTPVWRGRPYLAELDPADFVKDPIE